MSKQLVQMIRERLDRDDFHALKIALRGVRHLALATRDTATGPASRTGHGIAYVGPSISIVPAKR